jgi:hypothetical protein
MHDFALESMNPPAEPQWQDRLKSEGATIILTVQPVGWKGPWHEDPQAAVHYSTFGPLVCADDGWQARRDGTRRGFVR